MTKKPADLPPRVFPQGRWYYLVTAEGKRRVWTKLTLIKDGIPALYRKLADLAAQDIAPDRIPAVVVEWQKEIQPSRAVKTQENDEWVMGAIAEAFAEFTAKQATTPLCVEFLKDYRDRPRTYNLMRTGLLELFRFCELKGYRDPGTNPIPPIKRMTTPPRKKYVTDSELRRIKHAALIGRDGLQTRSGPTVCALIDMAYLTGQRIGDLLDLRWNKKAATERGEVVAPYIGDDAIYFQPDKTVASTGAKVAITWTPKLRELVKRIKGIRAASHRSMVFTNQSLEPLGYSTFATAWWRACDRAGIKDLHFHDIRAKAITDTDETHGRQAARRKGAHATEKQTGDYIRHRKAQKTEATR